MPTIGNLLVSDVAVKRRCQAGVRMETVDALMDLSENATAATLLSAATIAAAAAAATAAPG